MSPTMAHRHIASSANEVLRFLSWTDTARHVVLSGTTAIQDCSERESAGRSAGKKRGKPMSRAASRSSLFAAGLVVCSLPALAQSKVAIQRLEDQWGAAFN